MRQSKPTDTHVGNAVSAFLSLVEKKMTAAKMDVSMNAALRIFGTRTTGRSIRHIDAPELSNLRTGNWTKGNQYEVLQHIREGLDCSKCGIPELESWWESEIAKSARLTLQKIVDYELELIGAINENEALERLNSSQNSIGHNWPTREPVVGISWEELTPERFERPIPWASQHVQDMARDFLRGNENVGLWAAVHVAVRRPNVLDVLIKQSEQAPFVIVHGPVGEGKTVLLQQLGHEWLAKNRRVYWLHAESALVDPQLEKCLDASTRPLLILDNIGITKALPSWLRHFDGKGITLVVGVQTRKLGTLKPFKLNGAYREFALRSQHAQPCIMQIVDRIMEFKAADYPDRNRVREQFQHGLTGVAGGGLWCGLWQATRGMYLDDKIKTLVSELENFGDGPLGALAAVAFTNGLNEFSGDKLRDFRRSSLTAMIRELERTPEVLDAHCESLKNIGSLLAGEFLRHDIDSAADPHLELRHPSLAHSFFRHVFGAQAIDRGVQRVVKWPYFEALATVYNAKKDFGSVKAIIAQHSANWASNKKSSQFLPGMREHKFFETTKRIAARLPLDQWTPEVNLALATAALGSDFSGARVDRADQEYGKHRLIVAVADERSTPSQLLTGAALLQSHYVESHDWRQYALSAWIQETDKQRKMKNSYKILKLHCNDVDVTPQEIRIWAERSEIESGLSVDRFAHISLRMLAERFMQDSMRLKFCEYCSGPAVAANLGSVRAIFRVFWRLASNDKNETGYNIWKILTASRRPKVANEIELILKLWYQFDEHSQSEWPEGVISELGGILESPDKWLPFLQSYDERFACK